MTPVHTKPHTKPSAPRTPRQHTLRPATPLVLERPVEVSKSVGAVVLNPRGHVLLVFQKKNKYWEFPKGKMEEGERELDTLRREIFEETGIKRFRLVRNFRKVMYYDFSYHGRVIRRKVVYYLIQTNERVHISDEHTQYMWVPLLRARRRLKHKNQVRLLQEVFERVYGRTPTAHQRAS